MYSYLLWLLLFLTLHLGLIWLVKFRTLLKYWAALALTTIGCLHWLDVARQRTV